MKISLMIEAPWCGGGVGSVYMNEEEFILYSIRLTRNCYLLPEGDSIVDIFHESPTWKIRSFEEIFYRLYRKFFF